MTESTSPPDLALSHGAELEAERIVRAVILGAAFGWLLRLLGRRAEGRGRAARR